MDENLEKIIFKINANLKYLVCEREDALQHLMIWLD